MNPKLKTILALSVMMIYLSALSYAQGQLKVNFTKLRSKKGVIRIALYNSEEGFPEAGKEFKSMVVHATKAQCLFSNLSPGEYAIAAYHDENNNNDPEKNMLGIPKEGFCFSRNVRPRLKAPSFEQTSVMVKAGKCIKLKIEMCYR